MKTIKRLFVAFCVLSVLVSSCRDDEPNTCSDGIQNGTETGVDCGGDCGACSEDYYFEISYSGNTYYLDNDLFQSGHTWYNELGGYVPGDNLLYDPSLSIVFFFADTVQNIDLVDELNNKSIYFNSFDGPYPFVSITHSGWDFYRYTKRGLDTATYKVDISEVRFLRNEDDLFDMDIYAIRGTFTTQILDENEDYTEAYGSFYLQCSHGNY